MMRKYRLFLFLSYIVAICFVKTEGKISGNQLVTITAPSNNDLIYEKSIHVLYKTSPYLDNANYRICFKAVSIFGSVVMDIHCWDKSSQIIFDIPLPGDYFLYGGIAQDNKIIAEMDRIRIARYNKDEIQESVIRVTSKSFDKKDNKLTSLAELNGKTTLEFTYLFENFGIPLQQLQTCIYIIRKNPSTDYLALSCISTSSLAIVLNNVEIGDYIVYLVLKDMSTNSMLFGTTTKFDLRVVKVADDPPSILLGSPIVEGSVHNLHSKTNIDIQYRVFHQIESAISFWKLCVSLSKYKCSSDDRDILKPNLVSYSGQFSQSRPCLNASTPVFSHICVSTGQNMLHLSDLQEGFYHMKLALELNDQSSELKATSTEKHVIIDIRPQVEFVPSFDWQNLHAWHTIPNGLETRLVIVIVIVIVMMCFVMVIIIAIIVVGFCRSLLDFLLVVWLLNKLVFQILGIFSYQCHHLASIFYG